MFKVKLMYQAFANEQTDHAISHFTFHMMLPFAPVPGQTIAMPCGNVNLTLDAVSWMIDTEEFYCWSREEFEVYRFKNGKLDLRDMLSKERSIIDAGGISMHRNHTLEQRIASFGPESLRSKPDAKRSDV
jgi:hypothetical protein